MLEGSLQNLIETNSKDILNDLIGLLLHLEIGGDVLYIV